MIAVILLIRGLRPADVVKVEALELREEAQQASAAVGEAGPPAVPAASAAPAGAVPGEEDEIERVGGETLPARSQSPPRVRTSGVKRMDQKAFRATIDGWEGVRSCLEEPSPAGEDTDSKRWGKLKLKLSVNTSGEVVRARTISTAGPRARRIAPCVEEKALLIRFRAFRGTGVAVETATFVFEADYRTARTVISPSVPTQRDPP